MKTWRFVLNACLIWVLAAGMAWAQAMAGSQVSGIVEDSSGGVLPGVEVTITKTDTGVVRPVVTGADGAYLFPNLPVGPVNTPVTALNSSNFGRILSAQDPRIMQFALKFDL